MADPVNIERAFPLVSHAIVRLNELGGHYKDFGDMLRFIFSLDYSGSQEQLKSTIDNYLIFKCTKKCR